MDIIEIGDTSSETDINKHVVETKLSDAVCLLKDLEELQFSYLPITGSLPHCPGRTQTQQSLNGTNLEPGLSKRLEILRLDGNRLTGTLPPSLFDLPRLTKLDLAANALRGTLSPDLQNLKELRILSLRDNRFTGSVPTTLGRLKKLEALHLDHNPLHGCCSVGLCKNALFGNLRHLRVDCDPVHCPCATRCSNPCWCPEGTHVPCAPRGRSVCGEECDCDGYDGAAGGDRPVCADVPLVPCDCADDWRWGRV
uniref:Uncharacterized protein n=1 Tax=Corethron hystrix TaxID=216773 RepID=A0A7S1C0Q4_9STRA|mmetsp:Transcript_938/g.1833  ORF Transcript_938/g.1833 Transcript_938/m.1833 type:complete len:253 (+) Transcript_938:319-1077(+)